MVAGDDDSLDGRTWCAHAYALYCCCCYYCCVARARARRGDVRSTEEPVRGPRRRKKTNAKKLDGRKKNNTTRARARVVCVCAHSVFDCFSRRADGTRFSPGTVIGRRVSTAAATTARASSCRIVNYNFALLLPCRRSPPRSSDVVTYACHKTASLSSFAAAVVSREFRP